MKHTQIYETNTYINEYIYLGIEQVDESGYESVTKRNKFQVGDEIEIMKPDGSNIPVKYSGC
jgi:U32 family peptidase